jgi:hypothetical protein
MSKEENYTSKISGISLKVASAMSRLDLSCLLRQHTAKQQSQPTPSHPRERSCSLWPVRHKLFDDGPLMDSKVFEKWNKPSTHSVAIVLLCTLILQYKEDMHVIARVFSID